MKEALKIILYLFNSFPLLFLIIGLYIFKYITIIQILCLYLLYCVYWQIFSKTTFIYTKNKQNEKLLKNCPSLTNPKYKPHFLLPICIFQMLICEYWQPKEGKRLVYKVENVNNYGTKLIWAKLSDMKGEFTNEPILVLFPGMTGDTKDGYLQNLAYEGLKKGYNVVIYIVRFLSPDFGLNETGTFKLYEDIDQALDYIIERHKNSKIFAICGSWSK